MAYAFHVMCSMDPTNNKRYKTSFGFAAAKKAKIDAMTGVPRSEETKAKIAKAKCKTANIYCYETDELIAEKVVIYHWAKENGYYFGHFSSTARHRRNHTGGVYARYV